MKHISILFLGIFLGAYVTVGIYSKFYVQQMVKVANLSPKDPVEFGEINYRNIETAKISDFQETFNRFYPDWWL